MQQCSNDNTDMRKTGKNYINTLEHIDCSYSKLDMWNIFVMTCTYESANVAKANSQYTKNFKQLNTKCIMVIFVNPHIFTVTANDA